MAHFASCARSGMAAWASFSWAEETESGREVALKVMRPELDGDPTFRKRFLREARTLAALQHERIVRVTSVGESRGLAYLAMELLEGQTLQSWSKRQGFVSADQLKTIALQIAEGLALLHQKGFVHRDIKPANLWMQGRGAIAIKILDFGLVRTDGATWQTSTGQGFGTPGYISPEQAQGANVDARADLFSLGCVLFVLATHQMPFPGANPLAQLQSLALDPPVDLEQLRPDLPRSLRALILRLLEKQPEDRPQSAQLVTRLLATEQELAPLEPAIWEEATEPQPPTVPLRKPRRQSKGRWLRIAGLFVALGLGAALWWITQRPTIDGSPAPFANRRDDWLPRVQALPAAAQVGAVEAQLKLLNPGFDGGLRCVIRNDQIAEAYVVSDHLEDVSPFAALVHLERLEVSGVRGFGAGKFSDLSPLKGLKLKTLDCSNSQVRDLAPLADMPLEHLECSYTLIENLGPLKGARLRVLRMDFTPVRDLGVVQHLPLVHLSCSNTKVEDLSPLQGSAIHYLHFRNTPVRDVTVIRQLPLLENVFGPFERPAHDELLRSIRTLNKINGVTRPEFLR